MRWAREAYPEGITNSGGGRRRAVENKGSHTRVTLQLITSTQRKEGNKTKARPEIIRRRKKVHYKMNKKISVGRGGGVGGVLGGGGGVGPNGLDALGTNGEFQGKNP